jgi:hypothetical protein
MLTLDCAWRTPLLSRTRDALFRPPAPSTDNEEHQDPEEQYFGGTIAAIRRDTKQPLNEIHLHSPSSPELIVSAMRSGTVTSIE